MARQVENPYAYLPSMRDPVRPVNPYTPNQLVTDGSSPHLPVLGVVLLAGLILWLEHRRRRRGGK